MADRIIKPDSGNDVVMQNNGGSSKIEVNNDGTIVFTGSTNLIPSGTKMLFQQTSAPTGWTKVTSSNDVALRVVSGTVGSGGTVAFHTAFASQTIPTHTLTESEIPSHHHEIRYYNFREGSSGVTYAIATSATGSGGFNSGNRGGGGSHGHGSINLDVSFVDVIIATKD